MASCSGLTQEISHEYANRAETECRYSVLSTQQTRYQLDKTQTPSVRERMHTTITKARLRIN